MEKNYIRSDSLMDVEFLTDSDIGIHYHSNFELLYLLSGSLELTVEEERIHMEPEDIVVVNANHNHSYEGTENVFIARFIISAEKLRQLLNKDSVLFLCNSSIDKNEVFDDLREVIGKVLNQSLRKTDAKLYIDSLYYQILYILTSNFLLTLKDVRYEEKEKTDERIREIFAYIRMNYRQNITLQEMGEQLFLSPTYLSKYIKMKCGMNFGELINSVRMEHAMEDLIYTEESIMKIAMDNGFASVAAYNKVFKETHQMTPSEFRKSVRARSGNRSREQEQKTILLQKQIEDYLEKRTDESSERKHARIVEIHADTEENLSAAGGKNAAGRMDTGGRNTAGRMDTDGRNTAGRVNTAAKNVCRMINAGTALDLTKSAFQQQILEVRERIGIEYIRFWDIYAPELFIDIHAYRSQLHFGQLDLVFDFLVHNRLKPYVELGFKPIRLLRNTETALKETERGLEFYSDDEMWNFYNSLMEHLVKRYGMDEVSTWYFEYWEKENLLFRDLSYCFGAMTSEGHEEYLHRFDILANALRSRLGSVRIGGGGFPLQHYGENGFSQILKLWKAHKEQPDFISLTGFPYQQEKDGFAYYEKKNMDVDFILHNIELADQVMKSEGFADTPLHVSEYSTSLSNRNVVNDSCINGAFLLQNAIACAGKAEILGYWLLTDSYSDFYDSQNLLFGGCGLLTKNGIPKPGFYALEFFSRLYKQIVALGRNYIVTKSESGNYRIACHNYKALNYNYYISKEDEIQIEDLNGMLEDREHLTISLNLQPVEAGAYKIKQNIISRQYGSIQDEWRELDMESELSMEEQKYLAKISVPKLLIRKINAGEGRLECNITLTPNEIQYISIERI